MKRIFVVLVAGLVLFSLAAISYSAEYGTAKEAEALVKKAIANIKASGQEKGFSDISDPKGKFIDRDLYIFVYDMSGKCVAHGFNKGMIGKELIDMKDSDGKYFVKERVEIAKSKGSGWQDYKFTNPTSRKIEHKRAYVEKYENYIVGCGIYRM
jgi:cytochrome c